MTRATVPAASSVIGARTDTTWPAVTVVTSTAVDCGAACHSRPVDKLALASTNIMCLLLPVYSQKMAVHLPTPVTAMTVSWEVGRDRHRRCISMP